MHTVVSATLQGVVAVYRSPILLGFVSLRSFQTWPTCPCLYFFQGQACRLLDPECSAASARRCGLSRGIRSCRSSPTAVYMRHSGRALGPPKVFELAQSCGAGNP